jgi:ligand-binding sensor domain-containing protein
MKDANGYLWITTDKGVVRYDGYGFTTYTTRDGLSDNEVFEAFQDSKRRIWFSTLSGIPSIYMDGNFVDLRQIARQIAIG